jgi:hypothetical protein
MDYFKMEMASVVMPVLSLTPYWNRYKDAKSMGVIDTPAVHRLTRTVPSTNLGLSKCVRHGLQLESLNGETAMSVCNIKTTKEVTANNKHCFFPSDIIAHAIDEYSKCCVCFTCYVMLLSSTAKATVVVVGRPVALFPPTVDSNFTFIFINICIYSTLFNVIQLFACLTKLIPKENRIIVVMKPKPQTWLRNTLCREGFSLQKAVACQMRKCAEATVARSLCIVILICLEL